MCRLINFQILSPDHFTTVTIWKVYDLYHLEMCTFLPPITLHLQLLSAVAYMHTEK